MKANVYEQVTSRMIELLEQGVVPWQSPYFSKVGFPRNFVSGKPYRGINIFLLAGLRYTSPYFLTYLQAKELGGYVKKGERGALVVKYGTYTKDGEGFEQQQAQRQQQEGGNGSHEQGERRYLKAYTVFNSSQVEGITFPPPPALQPFTSSERCEKARQIVAGMPQPPAIKEGMAVPCYQPSTDSVHMPERGYFVSEEAYMTTLFHELMHSTGHQSRISRRSLLENKGMDATGEEKEVYAEEELVAEMGAAFLCAEAGIMAGGEMENSAAYLQSWIAALKSKDAKGWIVKAAGEAQRGANYIIVPHVLDNFEHENELLQQK